MTAQPTDDGSYYLDLEEDYEKIYKYGWRPDPFGEGTIPVGSCSNLCAPDEIQERERQNRLSKFETIPNTKPPRVDEKFVMKEFSRSAAGREFTKSMDLRPWSVLKRGLDHLLLDICFREDDWLYISGFVFDRLASIRQDMIIQRIEGKRYIEILEGSVRFLVYSLFRLTCMSRDFTEDPLDCAKLSPEGKPLSGLNNYELNIVREMKLTTQCLRNCLHSLIVQYQDYVPDSPNRYMFEAIDIIFNLPQLIGHQYNGTDLIKRQELRNSDPMFRVIYLMRREHFIGNHYGALKHLPRLREYPLIVLAYASVIPLLQVDMMNKFRRASASRGPVKVNPSLLTKIICPTYIDDDLDEQLNFTIYLAVQMGVYDFENNLIDFNFRNNVISNSYVSQQEQRLIDQIESDNETRIYALQMLMGRIWQFYEEVLNVCGLESVLDTSR